MANSREKSEAPSDFFQAMAPQDAKLFIGTGILVGLMLYAASCSGSHYTVTGPLKFRPNTQYKFGVTVYGVKISDYRLTAKIESSSGQVLVEKTFDVRESQTTALGFLNIPGRVPLESYKFVARAVGNVNFNISRAIDLISKTDSLFIQTDKSLYKPGQTVLFRIVAIDSNLKPLHLPINVTIYDHANNRIHQLVNLKNMSGVVNGHLKLSDITPLGQWRIEANTETTKKEVYFQVAEYVLPKFEVKVILPSYFFVNLNNPSLQENLRITTTAIYTFGKPVKGYANIRVSVSGWSSVKVGKNTVPYIEKRVELVDGKADLSIPLEQLNTLSTEGALRDYQNLFVQSNVTETETGVVLQGNGTVPVKTHRYQLEFMSISPDNFMPGFNYRAYVQLSQVDRSKPLSSDLVFPNGTFKKLHVSILQDDDVIWGNRDKVFDAPGSRSKSVYTVSLTHTGFVLIEILTKSFWNYFTVEVAFEDGVALSKVQVSKYISSFETRDKKFIQLSLVSMESVIKPNSRLTFKVKTTENIKDFQYQILGKGGILRIGTFYTFKPTTETEFAVIFDKDLAVAAAPEARIVVFYVTSTEELVADSLALTVDDYFANKVSLKFQQTSVAPGDEVLMDVTCSSGSYVSLLAVDQSVLLLGAGNELTKTMVSDDLQGYTNDMGGRFIGGPAFLRSCPIWIGGSTTGSVLQNAGLFVETNYHVLPASIYMPWFSFGGDRLDAALANMLQDGGPPVKRLDLDSPSQPPGSEPPRKIFPETWIWSDVVAGNDGSLKVKYTVPDTITSWVATAFATHSRDGLGIADESAKVTVIKPFFISLNLPYSIIRGEQFALQATIFNYFGQDLLVNVSLPRSNYFEVKECVHGTEVTRSETVSKIILVSDNDVVTVYFWIVATSLGQIPIEVKALAGVAGDSLIVNLLVKPEGQQQSYSSSSLVRISSRETSEVNFVVSLPPSDVLVFGSVIIEATLIGDVLGSAINNLDQLLQMPYGCGEQNMVTLAPDVYILVYLTTTGQLTGEIKTKALGFLNEGYQRELTYQRKDGSFSAFGNNDKEGSVWLSSFVLRVFEDAKDFIPVDSSKLTQTYEWILSHQDSEGVFKEPPEGRVIHTDMQGGSSSGIALTAYVAITLLKGPQTSRIREQAELTITYMERRYKDFSRDPYVLSIIGYAFYLAGSPELTNILRLLDSLAIKEGGLIYWHKENPGSHIDPDVWTPPYHRPQSNDVEMTSYVLLIYASLKDVSKSLPIAKWLIKNRNAQGGFTSTQDTVLGLEALAVFGQLVVPPVTSRGINVQVSQDITTEVYRFRDVNRETALLLQSVQLPSDTKNVKFRASGEGLCLVQVNVQYNVKSSQRSELIVQNLSVKSQGTKLDLQICLQWLGREQTGMVLTEVYILTGYVLSDDYRDTLVYDLGGVFKNQEYKNNVLSVYLDELTSKELCFHAKMQVAFYVKNVKPALVKTYQYYSPDVVTSGYYSPTSTSATLDVCDPIFS